VSGEKSALPIKKIVSDLRKKGNWIFGQIRANEKVTVERGGLTHSWFNGYYDNKGDRVEGIKNDSVRMTLIGQVFPVMSGLADNEEIENVIQAARHFLQDEQLGGFRLNTDFGVAHYLDLGRAFGFAYGNKENGAFFSHMNAMYAYALYKRGFVREGYNVLRSVYNMCTDTEKSKIYPGVPEYFDSQGRGYYHYLTGAASWLVLTQLTQVFGIRGEGGDLLLAPKLVKEEFDPNTTYAAAVCNFAGKKITVTFENSNMLDHGHYGIKEVLLNGEALAFEKTHKDRIRIQRTLIKNCLSECALSVVLDAA